MCTIAANFKKHLNYYIEFWKNGLDFSGKTDRGTFWITSLICYIFNGLICAVLETIGLSIVSCIFGAVLLVPVLALAVRRLRDIGKSWVWILIVFIPVIGWIWYIVLLCRKSV